LQLCRPGDTGRWKSFVPGTDHRQEQEQIRKSWNKAHDLPCPGSALTEPVSRRSRQEESFTMMVCLRSLDGDRAGHRLQIFPGDLLFGRAIDCGCRSESEFVSRYHCVLTLDESSLRVRDLGSKNGTYVSGRKIGGDECVLAHGDLLAIGDLRFQVNIVPSSPGIRSKRSGFGPSDNLDPNRRLSTSGDPFADPPNWTHVSGTGTSNRSIERGLNDEDDVLERCEKNEGECRFAFATSRK
jgi:pSer/pThr/pTyr-binding forkhead associated (FHA) protein